MSRSVRIGDDGNELALYTKGTSDVAMADLVKDLDIWELRRKDRQLCGGVVVESAITKEQRPKPHRCTSQFCCDGPFGFAKAERWAEEADANDQYRNGIRRLMEAEFAEAEAA